MKLSYSKNLYINHILTEPEIDFIDIKSALEQQNQNEEKKDSGWRFDKIISMKIYFYKTGELNASFYVKFLLKSSAILNFENDEKYCFLRSILAYLQPCNNSHPNRVSNYGQYFDELSIDGFDFSNGLKCSSVDNFGRLNNLSVNIFNMNFYQNENFRKQKIVPIEVGEKNSDRIVDLLIYRNHHVVVKKLHIFVSNHNCNFVCGQCLNSCTIQGV